MSLLAVLVEESMHATKQEKWKRNTEEEEILI